MKSYLPKCRNFPNTIAGRTAIIKYLCTMLSKDIVNNPEVSFHLDPQLFGSMEIPYYRLRLHIHSDTQQFWEYIYTDTFCSVEIINGKEFISVPRSSPQKVANDVTGFLFKFPPLKKPKTHTPINVEVQIVHGKQYIEQLKLQSLIKITDEIHHPK